MIITLQDEIPRVKGYVAGTDEVGRGPLAGNVVAAAVILNPECTIPGLDDSKKLSEKKRESLAREIRQYALAWSIVSISPAQIDEMNILRASLYAMAQSVLKLSVSADHVFVDGNHRPENLPCASTAIIKGDARVAAISAASILAKVERDKQMIVLHQQYPQYGFDRHKGYPTKLHRERLVKFGPCPVHRRSFAPVRQLLLADSAFN